MSQKKNKPDVEECESSGAKPQELIPALEAWARWTKDYDDANFNSVNELILDNGWDKLKDIMMKRLVFGTAGIRGKMGPG